MKDKLGAVLFGCVMLVACGERPVYNEPTEGTRFPITNTKPDHYGVVCYQLVRSEPALSCVQVVKGE